MDVSNQRKLGTILSYTSIILSTLIQIVYTPFLINHLGDSEYGLYSLVSSIIGYLVVLDFGFGDAIIMYTAKYHAQKKYDEEKKLQGMFLLIFTVIGILTIFFGLAIYFNIGNIFGNAMTNFEISKMKVLMLILTFNLAITFPFSVYASIIRAYEKFIFQKIINIINILLQPLLMIPLLFLGCKSISLALIITVLNIFVIISNYSYCRNKLNVKIKFLGFDKVLFKSIFAYSFYIFLNIVVDKINWSVDQILLGMFSGTMAVSMYSVASKINNLFIKMSTAISGILFPKVSRMIALNRSDKEISDEFIKVGRLQYYIIFLLVSGLVIFGKEFFIIWVGSKYIASYYIALLLIIPLSVPLIQNLGISILQAKNIHKFRSILYLFVAIGNILMSIPLTKLYGGIGAAIGTSISLIIGNIIIINIYYYKKAHLDIPKFWKEIINMTIPFVIPIIIIIILNKLIVLQGVLYLVVFISLYTLMYGVTCYYLVFNKYEKDLFIKVLNKIGIRGKMYE